MIEPASSFFQFFSFFERAIIAYVAAINAIYFFLMVLGFFALRRYRDGLIPEDREALLRSPLLPEITIVVPAHNEELSICESVKALLNLNYPKHDVIVVRSDRQLSPVPVRRPLRRGPPQQTGSRHLPSSRPHSPDRSG